MIEFYFIIVIKTENLFLFLFFEYLLTPKTFETYLKKNTFFSISFIFN